MDSKVLSGYRQKMDRLIIRHKMLTEKIKEEREELVNLDQSLTQSQEAQGILQAAAEILQNTAHRRIAGIVTRSLQAVFGDGQDPYEFVIQFERKRGRTEATLGFKRDGEVVDPMSASGGGVVDVASFALRLSCLLLKRPAIRRLLVLDELWKHLSEQYRPAMRELIEKLSEELGVQFVIITHSEEFKIGKVVEL